MSDAPRELAYRLHFLGLKERFPGLLEFLLDVTAFGQISRDLCEADEASIRGKNAIDDNMGPEATAILSDPPPLVLQATLVRRTAEVDRRSTQRAILGGIENFKIPADDFLG